jgi:hypothetical protein
MTVARQAFSFRTILVELPAHAAEDAGWVAPPTAVGRRCPQEAEDRSEAPEDLPVRSCRRGSLRRLVSPGSGRTERAVSSFRAYPPCPATDGPPVHYRGHSDGRVLRHPRYVSRREYLRHPLPLARRRHGLPGELGNAQWFATDHADDDGPASRGSADKGDAIRRGSAASLRRGNGRGA